ncbi:hypothetical protein [Mycolicibacterium sp.]|uniref:hypothetical protein n=1 Tax=Mycolicibacterium sp. TaxID=2320850 RepID=UPI001A328F74|nr:hypothetical protein [Mycolicibacterium sp.]MBJ7340642.1 hypothetical protein [Mycolicibacterium sp.]
MKKIHVGVAATAMGALAMLSAPQASAEFDRAAYLRCMVSDSMSVGGLSLDSSSAAKLGAEAYAAVGGQSQSAQQEEIAALAKKHQLSESVANLIVQCAQRSGT